MSIIRFIDAFEKFVGAVGRWQGAPDFTMAKAALIDVTPTAPHLVQNGPESGPERPAPTYAELKAMKHAIDFAPVPQCANMRRKLNAKKQAYQEALAAHRTQAAIDARTRRRSGQR